MYVYIVDHESKVIHESINIVIYSMLRSAGSFYNNIIKLKQEKAAHAGI